MSLSPPREVQKAKDETIARLAAHQQKEQDNDEELIIKAIEEKDSREARQQREKEEKREAMLQSIAAHRETTVNCFQFHKFEKKITKLHRYLLKKTNIVF